MKPSVLDSPIHCARADLAKLRRFIRRDHLYLRSTDFAPGDGRMISLIQHNQPVLLDGDLDSPFRMVHRLPNVLCFQAEGIWFPIAPFGRPGIRFPPRQFGRYCHSFRPRGVHYAVARKKSFATARLFLRDFSPRSES